MEAFLGTIIMVGFNFAPEGWLVCDGSMLEIQQYMALFALLGTTYGGDGVKTFALPDLRGCVPAGAGQGGKAPVYEPGEMQQLPAAGSGGTGTRVLGVNFIIATQGIFPPRP